MERIPKEKAKQRQKIDKKGNLTVRIPAPLESLTLILEIFFYVFYRVLNGNQKQ